MTIAGVLLAAGRSQRMGQSKLLLPWHGLPLVRYVAQTSLRSRIDELVVVVGDRSRQVQAAMHGLSVRIVENETFAQGQSTSLRAGIAALSPDVDAALILLADQPFVEPHTLDMLIAVYRQQQPLVVAPRYQGQRGNPVLFARALFSQLLQIRGDTGARAVLKAWNDRTVIVDVADEGVVLDIDTPAAYEQARRRAANQHRHEK